MFSSALFALATLAQNANADWPQYRGPSASGLDASRVLPTSWNVETGENIRWHAPIPGLAHSSPIVADDRVYVATAVSPKEAELKVGLYGDIKSANDGEEQEWRLLALDQATGKILWNTLAVKTVPKVKRHTKASHCNSTPATDGQHIVAIFGSEGLFCFDKGGDLVWKKVLGPHGRQGSYMQTPLVVSNLLFACNDMGILTCFDALTGTVIEASLPFPLRGVDSANGGEFINHRLVAELRERSRPVLFTHARP